MRKRLTNLMEWLSFALLIAIVIPGSLRATCRDGMSRLRYWCRWALPEHGRQVRWRLVWRARKGADWCRRALPEHGRQVRWRLVWRARKGADWARYRGRWI